MCYLVQPVGSEHGKHRSGSAEAMSSEGKAQMQPGRSQSEEKRWCFFGNSGLTSQFSWRRSVSSDLLQGHIARDASREPSAIPQVTESVPAVLYSIAVLQKQR